MPLVDCSSVLQERNDLTEVRMLSGYKRLNRNVLSYMHSNLCFFKSSFGYVLGSTVTKRTGKLSAVVHTSAHSQGSES